MSFKDVCDKLDIIISLLADKQQHNAVLETQQQQSAFPVNIKHALNRSKYVNDEQRTKIFNYIRLPKVVNALNQLPKHKQQSALQTMIKDELDITISYYMCAKLVHIIHSNATQQNEVLSETPSDEFLSE